MHSSFKFLVVLAAATSGLLHAQPAVFLRGDSVVFANNDGVYQSAKQDSVYTPWKGSDAVTGLCGSLHWADAPGGRLYAWGDAGICLVGPQGTRKILTFASGATKTPKRFAIDPKGRIAVQFFSGDWLTAQDDEGNFQAGPPDTFVREGAVQTMLDGSLWRTSGGFLLHQKGPGRLDSFPLPSPTFDVFGLATDASGWILATDWIDLYRIRKGECVRIPLPGVQDPTLRKLLTDSAGHAWVLAGTALFRFQDSSLVLVDLPRRHKDRFQSFAIDGAGVPWVATLAGDLLHHVGDGLEGRRVNFRKPTDTKVKLWTNAWIPEFLGSVLVRIPGPHKRLWAVYGDRILQWEADSLKVLDTPFGGDTTGNQAVGVMALSETDITVQTDDLMQWRWNGTGWKLETPASTFLGSGVVDDAGDSWMGTWDGFLWKGVGGAWVKVDPKETSNSFRSGVYDAVKGPVGDLYFATDSGIVSRKSGTWEAQRDAKKCRRVEVDPNGALFRLCDDQWAIGDGRTWKVVDTAKGAIPAGMFTAAGDSTVWFHRNGLKVWVKGRTVDFPILASSIPPDVRAIGALDDGRVAMAGPGFFAIRDRFSLSEVGVGIGTGAARAPRLTGAAVWRNGRLELSGLPIGASVRLGLYGTDGRIHSRATVVSDESGRASLSKVVAAGKTLRIRVEPQGFPAWSASVVGFP
ncbi:MAG: hypothetical protein IPK50_13160 [Fibrobacterota bacterium]|nr:hypothetical protein [Fibrobacterota bacterium]QQS03258.1 MAG: hypothetical protein IPK50_13160 [Fibrobacterota bacterium]